MQWTIRIEFTSEGNDAPSREVGIFTRAELQDELIGLTLEEGRQLIQFRTWYPAFRKGSEYVDRVAKGRAPLLT